MVKQSKETYRDRLARIYGDAETAEKVAANDGESHLLDFDADEAEQQLREEVLENEEWIADLKETEKVLAQRRAAYQAAGEAEEEAAEVGTVGAVERQGSAKGIQEGGCRD
jgi:hypothetical protein